MQRLYGRCASGWALSIRPRDWCSGSALGRGGLGHLEAHAGPGRWRHHEGLGPIDQIQHRLFAPLAASPVWLISSGLMGLRPLKPGYRRCGLSAWRSGPGRVDHARVHWRHPPVLQFQGKRGCQARVRSSAGHRSGIAGCSRADGVIWSSLLCSASDQGAGSKPCWTGRQSC